MSWRYYKGTVSNWVSLFNFDAEEVESNINRYGCMSELCEDGFLDRTHSKSNKTGGSDGLVGELLKYGGSGML